MTFRVLLFSLSSARTRGARFLLPARYTIIQYTSKEDINGGRRLLQTTYYYNMCYNNHNSTSFNVTLE